MSRLDASSPQKLTKCQLWFASIITQPIDEESHIPEVAPSGALIENEACGYIKPSPTLRPAARIEIYAQQYWWRLLNTLHDIYPFVTRLFGYQDFNYTIAIPYLQKYPPTHWSLNFLGNQLPRWIEDEYHASDKQLVLDAAQLDYAYQVNFLARELKPLDQSDLPGAGNFSSLLTSTLYLQPFLQLLKFDYDLLSFRFDFLKECPEYWLEHDFPELKPIEVPFVLFRNMHGQAVWDTLSVAEFMFLSYFRKGATIEEACQWLEQQDQAIYEEAEQKLHLWIQSWIIKKWLSLQQI